MFARFFIDRPIFATVLSILIVIIGGISFFALPQAQYPDIAPPTVNVSASFPGADAATVSETVAIPIEEQINGVEGMLYMESVSTNDGAMSLNVTFDVGTNLDMALVLVQNRVALATSKLPETVRRIGVTTKKRSPSLLLVANYFSLPKGKPEDYEHIKPADREYIFSPLEMSNFLRLNIKDNIARCYGVGEATIFGEKEYSMRVWLDPAKMSARGLSATDVTSAVSAQNIQVAAGQLGRSPIGDAEIMFQYSLRAHGRLLDEEEFGDIVIKTDSEGRTTFLRDVARIEMGAKEMDVVSYNEGVPCVSLGIFQLPGTNALQCADAVKAKLEELRSTFREGMEYEITFDTTPFIRESIHEVEKTLRDAVVLVAVVVLLFLQSWRATIIPLLAVPVSLVGTFAVMNAMGFSLNNLSLFGLVLAIGIVVDDAIVVVECVERHMEDGLAPKEAARAAMDEVSGALVAIALVLSCVFVPVGFLSGVTGQFFQQFALTIAVATIISCFNSLTLSPAMSALLLRPKGSARDPLTWVVDNTLGWLVFKPFNWLFGLTTTGYVWAVKQFLRLSLIVLVLYVGLLYITAETFSSTPTGFIPPQDRGFVSAMVQLPDSASASRTRAVMEEFTDGAKKIPGIAKVMTIEGMSFATSSKASNMASAWIILDSFDERKISGITANDVVRELVDLCGTIPDATINVIPPAPVDGMGNSVGFSVQFQDKNAYGVQTIQEMQTEVMRRANATPGLQRVYTQYRAAVPQMYVNIDRERAFTMGVPVGNIFDALQTYLGAVYVNDMTFIGRNFQVNVQADAKFRLQPENIAMIHVPNNSGGMVPLGSLVSVEDSYGPLSVNRYNMYPSAPMNGEPAAGYSSGQAREIMGKVMRDVLPQGMDFEWTSLALLEERAGNSAIYVFFIAILFVFLVLAAQYESWALPLAIILVVPMCLLCSLIGVRYMKMDMNIFTQIGFLVLVGLASKNAILIVEFAKQRSEAGLKTMDATLEACRLRLRPIIMTSLAFILGVVPLLVSRGAGFEMRQILGVAVFSGMLGVTAFGIFLTPVFFYVIESSIQLGGKLKTLIFGRE
ncbi:MAG: multidrug efflux RND transporter permease subunit [Planctomycetia bacterium]|nr:multidrug efflux RND transporter permease subunit [Planctomycetia bacterium]